MKNPKDLTAADFTYINESELCAGTEDDELLSAWEMKIPASSFADPIERKAYEAFVAKKGGFNAT